jgi:hypothetical protein
MESLAIESDDASGLLPPVLERMEPKRRDSGRIGMAEDAEDAALFAQPIVVKPDWTRARIKHTVMRGLVPRIHVFLAATKTWMAGTTGSPLRKRSGVPVPAMTGKGGFAGGFCHQAHVLSGRPAYRA